MFKLAIASGKGGTGKTTLSTNLADYLSDRGHKVVLADLDVEEPNSGLFIKGKIKELQIKYKHIPEWDSSVCTLCGKCENLCNFHALLKLNKTIMVLPELCHSCYACSELCPVGALPMHEYRIGEFKQIDNGIFDFFESRLDIGQEQAVPLIAQSLESIHKNYDYGEEKGIVIIDSPPGTSCPVIEAVKTADLVLLVTEPTPFGLHDLSLAVNTMREIKKPFVVVINRDGIGNDDVEKYCIENKIKIISKFPNMRKAAEIYSKGGIIHKEIPEFKTELEKIETFLEYEYRSIF